MILYSLPSLPIPIAGAGGFEFVNEAEGLFFDWHILGVGVGGVVLVEILLRDAISYEL